MRDALIRHPGYAHGIRAVSSGNGKPDAGDSLSALCTRATVAMGLRA